MHVDIDKYKEARNEVQKLICTKKKAYFENKLTKNIGKPKKLWRSLFFDFGRKSREQTSQSLK